MEKIAQTTAEVQTLAAGAVGGGARNALDRAGCVVAGCVSSGPEMAGSFGSGSTVPESHPTSRTARDFAELWASIRSLMAQL